MNRIFAGTNFAPARSANGLISSVATGEEATQYLSVKRFSSPTLELPDNFYYTPMAPVMLEATKKNFAAHTADKDIKGINQLEGAHKGKTMVLCGAGYSLNMAREILPPKGSDAHKDMIVVAVNGSMKGLNPNQIDYFAALDWSAKEEWHKGYPTDGIPAIIGLTTPGHFRDGFKDRYYFTSNIFGWDKKLSDEWVKKIGQLDAGKCISYSMMHMAYQMGCSKVIFIGHEFAAVGGHALGNYYYFDKDLEFNYAASQKMTIAQDIFGRATITGPIMIGNCEMVMTASRFCEMDNMTCINASEGGIMAMQNRCMPFEEAINFTPDIPVHIPVGRDQAIPAIDWSQWRKVA